LHLVCLSAHCNTVHGTYNVKLLACVILKQTECKGSNVCGSFDKSPLIIPE
jgi:hypothetical protein